jgi:metal-responsive CopG/Arc/MetJ family transcriptional regulator
MSLQTDWMKDQRIPVMMSAEEVEAIDEWRRKHPDLPSRSEAIRQLVQLGLKPKQRKEKGTQP